jgi:hypothetical protein
MALERWRFLCHVLKDNKCGHRAENGMISRKVKKSWSDGQLISIVKLGQSSDILA